MKYVAVLVIHDAMAASGLEQCIHVRHPVQLARAPSWIGHKGLGLDDLSSVQNPCWLMILGDFTTQHIGDDDPRTGNPYKPRDFQHVRDVFSGNHVCLK